MAIQPILSSDTALISWIGTRPGDSPLHPAYVRLFGQCTVGVSMRSICQELSAALLVIGWPRPAWAQNGLAASRRNQPSSSHRNVHLRERRTSRRTGLTSMNDVGPCAGHQATGDRSTIKIS